MRTVYIKCGGLMEDPEWHWEVFGEGEGETLDEVMDDIIRHQPQPRPRILEGAGSLLLVGLEAVAD
jgi:hypothetical protein